VGAASSRDLSRLEGAPTQAASRQNAAPASGYETVHRALLTGLLGHIGLKDERKEYLGARGMRFWIHPGSGQFDASPKWIMAAERVQTTKDYGRIVARIQPEWIERAGAHLLNRSYSEPHWQSERGQVAAFEKVTLYGLVLAAQRRINYGPINPAEARGVFIRSALVDRDFQTRAPFFRHNQELIEYVEHLEAKSRRRDLLVDEAAIHAFYDARIPADIASGPAFEKWLRRACRQEPKLLHMRMDDLMRQEAETVTQTHFPDGLEVGGSHLPLEYHFDPGQPTDGVTLVVPLALVNQVPMGRCDWLVPGLLEERITALLRGLPKHLRKLFVPIPDTAARLTQRLTPSDRPLVQALGEALRELTGVHVPEDAWNPDTLPEHLRMGFRLVDDAGHALASGRDFAALRRAHGGQGRQQFAQVAQGGLERDGITRWDFGALPETLRIERGGIPLQGHPALVDCKDSVALRLLDSAESAAAANRAGLRRLLILTLPTETRQLRKHLPGLGPMRLQYAKAPAPVGAASSRDPSRLEGAPTADLADELIAMIIDRAFLIDRPPIRDADAFAARIAAGRGGLMTVAGEVCRLVADLLATYQRIRKRLDGITQAQWQPSLQDMRAQLDGLVYRGFLHAAPYPHLAQYPRYLRALETRLERLPGAAARDRQWVQELAPLFNAWQTRSVQTCAAGRQDPRLEEIRWMLEELRISLFAQPQPTAYPVSVQRIERRWKDLGL